MDNKLFESQTGQMSFFPIDKKTENLVVQSNNLIKGRQNLTLNEAKLLRIIIMQIVAQDVEFRPYEISIVDLAKMIGNDDASNLYKRAKDFTDKLQTKRVELKSDNGSWKSFVWVPTCSYDADTKKIKIRLNDDLKPYLLNLVEIGYYTQYALETALAFKSVYALRIYELLMEQLRTKLLPKSGADIELMIADIRDACMLYKTDAKGKMTTEVKFERISQLKSKVIDLAAKEINEATTYYVTYTDIKQGRAIVGFRFHIGRGFQDNPQFFENTRLFKEKQEK